MLVQARNTATNSPTTVLALEAQLRYIGLIAAPMCLFAFSTGRPRKATEFLKTRLNGAYEHTFSVRNARIPYLHDATYEQDAAIPSASAYTRAT